MTDQKKDGGGGEGSSPRLINQKGESGSGSRSDESISNLDGGGT